MQVSDFMSYPADFIPAAADEGGGFTVVIHHSNDEKEGWITEGDDFDDAMEWARQCIFDAFDFDAGQQLIPHTVPAKPGQIMVSISMDRALKAMLRNAMFEQGIRVSDIAKAKGVRPQKIFNLLNFEKATKLELLRPLFEFIGRPLAISC